jgi:hypothetical protein
MGDTHPARSAESSDHLGGCAAVAVNAISHNLFSSTISTTRVTSRTFEYDSRPSRNAALMVGMRRSALATRTCSRATPGVIEQALANQWATDLKSVHNLMAPTASNSPINSNSWHCDCADTSAAAQIFSANASACAFSAGHTQLAAVLAHHESVWKVLHTCPESRSDPRDLP